jgi:uncharacterized protein YkwD
MGRAIIQSHLGAGHYSIKVSRNEDLINKKITWIDEQLLTAAGIRKTTLEKQKQKLQALIDNDPQNAWCADYSTALSGVVDTIEINGEASTVMIAPATPGHHELLSGIITPVPALSGAQAGHSWAVFPGWQYHMPTYRLGEITALDKAAGTCDVNLDPAASYINGANINQQTSLEGVPIDYMSCGAVPFEIGSRVAVEFKNQSWSDPHVIGFETNPKDCPRVMVAIISNQSGSQAIAWDLYNNALVLGVDTLANISGALVAMGYEPPVEATYDTVSETFDIPAAVSTTHTGDYDQPTYLEGAYVDMEYELSVSRPIPASLNYTALGHQWLWDYRYLTAPGFVQDIVSDAGEHYKGCSLISLKLFPDYLDSDKQDEFHDLCGGVPGDGSWFGNVWIKPFQNSCVDPHCPYGPERTFFFFHSLFDVPPGYAIIENLEQTCIELLDSWADVFRGGFAPDGDSYNADYEIGYADTDLGSIVFECGQACDNVDVSANECEDDDMSGRRVFRLFAYQKYELNGLAEEIVALINEYREDEGAPPLADNMGLLKAAQRHASDAAANDIDGGIGSDGSSVQSRLEDAGYYLWVRTGIVTVSKVQIMEVGEDLNAADVLSAWKEDPSIDADLLDSDYLEASAAVETGGNGKNYLVVIMAGCPYRWPGFCPVDTTAIDEYLEENFCWSGDQLRLVNVLMV